MLLNEAPKSIPTLKLLEEEVAAALDRQSGQFHREDIEGEVIDRIGIVSQDMMLKLFPAYLKNALQNTTRRILRRAQNRPFRDALTGNVDLLGYLDAVWAIGDGMYVKVRDAGIEAGWLKKQNMVENLAAAEQKLKDFDEVFGPIFDEMIRSDAPTVLDAAKNLGLV